MNEDLWNYLCKDTVDAMIEHVKPFLSPISYTTDEGYGILHGTGSYITFDDKEYLITNEHVGSLDKKTTLQNQFFNDDNIYLLKNKFKNKPYPIDVAISHIDKKLWSTHTEYAQAIPSNRFALKHNPYKNELLFLAGYSGERSGFHYNNLISRCTPYLTQEIALPDNIQDADAGFHFSLPYKPELATSVDGTSSLPDPHGFSGSLVWDTKRIACLVEKRDWEPSMAEVTGILWGWPSSSSCLLATRVEKLSLKDLL
ncbi:TPA: hypothetical protein J1W44_004452 [Escherichia coli]|nr:hypothetical protein [Escherichia coli]